jgi:hypothetical protein
MFSLAPPRWKCWTQRERVDCVPGHFPSREALIEAVYPMEVEKLASADQSFAETAQIWEAIRALVSRAIKSDARKDLDPIDLLRADRRVERRVQS